MAARWMEKSLSSERGHEKYRKCTKVSQEGRLGETMGKKKWGGAGGKHSHLARHLCPTSSPHSSPKDTPPTALHTGDIFPQGLVCGVGWRGDSLKAGFVQRGWLPPQVSFLSANFREALKLLLALPGGFPR